MNSAHSHLFIRRDDCVSCTGPAPTCNCAADESCVLTSRTCSACPSIQCIKSDSGSSKSASVNPGAIAGPVVAVLVLSSLALFWWLRRKKRRDLARLEALAARARKAESAGFHLSSPSSPTRNHHDSARRSFPASVATGDGSIHVYSRQQGEINLDPKRQTGGPGNPFSDRESVSTGNSQTALSFASSHSTNVIPIQYMSTGQEEDGDRARNPAQTLDAARQNLLRLPNGAPSRPARSPDLDLRLKPSGPSRTVGGSPSTSRDSFRSGVSGTPSFLSGMSGATDFNMDAPKIVTSKQVHVGRLQQAEVVHFGQPRSGGMEVLGQGFPHHGVDQLSPVESVGDPFADARTRSPDSAAGDRGMLMPRNPNTNSVSTFGALPSGSSYATGQASGAPSFRSLTPSSHRFADADDGGDLRFSMGSLAMDGRRDSSSTQGTRWSSSGQSAQVAAARVVQVGAPPPGPNRQQVRRDSSMSARSAADSLLSSFPMIPPSDRPHVGNQSSIPQSTSVSTLDHHATISRPPPAFRSTKDTSTRPTTTHSVADSLLSSFPFMQSTENLAEMPVNAAAHSSKGGRHTMGMSMASEGLGGFDFKFEDGPEPPLPGRDGRKPEDRDSIDTMWVSNTVKEHGVGQV